MADETRAPSRRWIHTRIGRLVSPALALLMALPLGANGSASGDRLVVAARDAHAKRDAAAVASARAQLVTERHPLAPWADYWDLNLRLARASVPEVESFYSRWSGSYVEDRLRNDWLLELGKRRDWQVFRRDYPRFRMNDDPPGHLLRDHGRAPRGQARARARARGLARAARCGRRLPAHGAHAALGGRVRRAGGVGQGAPRHRVEPLGCRTQRARPARGGARCEHAVVEPAREDVGPAAGRAVRPMRSTRSPWRASRARIQVSRPGASRPASTSACRKSGRRGPGRRSAARLCSGSFRKPRRSTAAPRRPRCAPASR